MKFDPSFDAVSQLAHTLEGLAFVLVPAVLCIHHPTWFTGHPQIIGSWVGVVYAAVKEFSWDENFEDAITRGSTWRDFIFYMIGIALGNIILL